MAGAVYGNASHGAVTIGTPAAPITVSATTTPPLGNRTNIVIYNNDPTNTLYLGFGSTASGVTVNNGIPVQPGGFIDLDFGPQIAIWGIASVSISVRYIEAF